MLSTFTCTQNAPAELASRCQMKFNRESKPLLVFLWNFFFRHSLKISNPLIFCPFPSSPFVTIAMFRVTSPIDINVPTRGLLAVETESSFVFMVGTFEKQKGCL